MAGTTLHWKDDSERNHDIVYRFEKAFAEGKNPQVKDYLEGEGASRWRLLLKLLHSDLELRIRGGQSLRVQEYLKEHPELAQHPDDLAALIKTEIRCLRLMGIQPMLQKYQAEYGSILGKRLEEMFAHESRGTREAKIGSIIAGKYKLLAELGEGGMGSVYAAEQTQPVRRIVAMKLIKPGMDSSGVLARFEAERQALAMMDHPNIARMLDGGITEDGQPYFVMEQVKGLPITRFCDQERLSLDDRIELFMAVCQGVQHAHQKGIIHRDLKPSNILVTLIDGKPVPKVIDFGVAKALHQKLTDKTMYTEAGRMVGTLEYMAPEQADLNNLDVDTRADVYALGVVLYELLTGQVPFTSKELRSAAYDEMLRIIREMEPPRPSTKLSSSVDLPKVAAMRQVAPKQLTSVVAGELDWIVMKCLEKERGRRYETANALGRELGRYLVDEPVEARPPSIGYRLGKFVRRNRAKVVTVSLLLLSIIAGIIGTSWGLVNSIEQEHIAIQEKNAKDKALQEESKQKKLAQQATAEASRKATDALSILERLQITNGISLIESGDFYLGMLWLAQPLLNEDSALQKDMHHKRIASYWRDNKYPRLIQFFTQKKLSFAKFSPDGQRIVATDWSGVTARVWDVLTGKPLTPEMSHHGTIFYAEFSSDGRRVVTASWDKHAGVWDASTGKQLALMRHGGDELQKAHFSPDGKYVLTLGFVDGANGKITDRIWNASTGEPILSINGGDVFSPNAVFCSDSQHVITSGVISDPRIWDISTGQSTTITVGGLNKSIVAFNQSGRIAAACTRERAIQFFDTATGNPILTNVKHVNKILKMTFSPDSRRLLIVCDDHSVWIIDTVSGQLSALPMRHVASVKQASFSPDGRYILTSSDDHCFRIWDSQSGQPLSPRVAHNQTLDHTEFSPDGSRVLSVGGGIAKIWDMTPCILPNVPNDPTAYTRWGLISADGAKALSISESSFKMCNGLPNRDSMTRFIIHDTKVDDALFSHNGDHILTVSDNVARVMQTKDGLVVGKDLIHDSRIRIVAFSHDDKAIMTVANDDIVRLWNISTGKSIATLKRGSAGIRCAVLSPDSKKVIAVSHYGIHIWDVASDKHILAFEKGSSDAVRHVQFSSDGLRLVTASDYGLARVWQTETGKPLTPPMFHAGPVYDAQFSPDGLFIATASSDRTARIWDARTGVPASPPLIHSSEVRKATFSPDGKLILTICVNNSVRIWDVVTGLPVSPYLTPDNNRVNSVFSSDSRRVYSSQWNGITHVWDCTAGNRTSADWIQLFELVTGNHIDPMGGVSPLSFEQQASIWKNVSSQHESALRIQSTLRAWRQGQIVACMREKNLDAAMFHQMWLIADAVVESSRTKVK